MAILLNFDTEILNRKLEKKKYGAIPFVITKMFLKKGASEL